VNLAKPLELFEETGLFIIPLLSRA
jgi:hypothetical protein